MLDTIACLPYLILTMRGILFSLYKRGLKGHVDSNWWKWDST